jgi:predicted AlkP superfamily pyrophosphatase or phosphodiesterase
MSKTIVVMIDGLGADYFTKYCHRLPYLSAIAERGTLVDRVSPERCGTSLPGRTSIVTGVASSQHGIYGNIIWDGSQFRYANWTDVKAPTIAEQATKAGLTVANIGYAMLNPAHSALFYPPSWAHELLQPNEDGSPSNADKIWLEQMEMAKQATWLNPLVELGYPEAFVARDYEHPTEYLLSGQMNDQIMIDWTAGVTCTRPDVDLAIMEIGMPDYFLHRFGCEHDLTRLAIETADAQVGRLVHALERANQLDSTNILVTSDHGFSPITQSIHPENILMLDDNAAQFSCEGGVLHLHYQSIAQLESYTAQLAKHGVSSFSNDYLPTQDQNQVACFLAPSGCDFHLDNHHCRKAMGPAKYKANHGFKPGHSADERFLAMAGPDVPNDHISTALAQQVAPTIAHLSGLSTEFYPMNSLL